MAIPKSGQQKNRAKLYKFLTVTCLFWAFVFSQDSSAENSCVALFSKTQRQSRLENEIQMPYAAENQCDTGACHIFTTKGYLESQAVVAGHKVRLSADYIYAQHLMEKAIEIIRSKKKNASFYPGAHFYDDLIIAAKDGLVPASSWKPKVDIMKEPFSSNLVNILQDIIDIYKPLFQKVMSEKQKAAVLEDAIADIKFSVEKYVGKLPQKIEFNNHKITPQDFIHEILPDFPTEVELVYSNHTVSFSKTKPFNRRYGEGKKDYIHFDEQIISPKKMIPMIQESIDGGRPVPLLFFALDEYTNKETGLFSFGQKKQIRKQNSDDLHLVLIVGYQQDPRTKRITLKVRNSWGGRSGENGDYTINEAYFLNYAKMIYLPK